jgi:hypothetical protein
MVVMTTAMAKSMTIPPAMASALEEYVTAFVTEMSVLQDILAQQRGSVSRKHVIRLVVMDNVVCMDVVCQQTAVCQEECVVQVTFARKEPA